MENSCLPFERGRTMADYALTGVTLDSTSYLGICGKPFEVLDAVHGTGQLVTLIPLKNVSGGSLTVARKFLKFDTAALEFGRACVGFADAAGEIVVALDDKYTVGDTIVENDVFLAVLKGPVGVLTGATAVSLAQGAAVATDNTGCVAASAATAGQFVAGTLDAATTDEDTEVVVHMNGSLAMPPAAG